MVSSRQILGIRFFNGDVDEAVTSMFKRGGFLVAPSGTCFARLREDERYRRAIVAADLAIADSSLMVLLWRLLRRQKVERISGYKYLKHLLGRLKGEGKRDVFWILATKHAQRSLSRLVAPRRFIRRREELLCRAVVRIGSRRSRSSCAA